MPTRHQTESYRYSVSRVIVKATLTMHTDGHEYDLIVSQSYQTVGDRKSWIVTAHVRMVAGPTAPTVQAGCSDIQSPTRKRTTLPRSTGSRR